MIKARGQITITDTNDGKSVIIVSTETAYQISDSATTPPTGTWTVYRNGVAIPVATDDKPYLWTRTTVTYNQGTPVVSYSVSRRGKDAVDYDVSLSLYQGSVTVDDDGNITDGLYSVSSDGVKQWRLSTAVFVRKGTTILTEQDGTDTVTKGHYRVTATSDDCICEIHNSTVYITAISNLRSDGSGSIDLNAMRKMSSCRVSIVVDLEGVAAKTLEFPISINHNGTDAVTYEVDPDKESAVVSIESSGDDISKNITVSGKLDIDCQYKVYKKTGDRREMVPSSEQSNNLLPNSGFTSLSDHYESDYSGYHFAKTATVIGQKDGVNILRLSKGENYPGIHWYLHNVSGGQTYTFSAWIRMHLVDATDFGLQLDAIDSGNSRGGRIGQYNPEKVESDWVFFKKTFTLEKNTSYPFLELTPWIFSGNSAKEGNTLDICQPKLEIGTEATPYSTGITLSAAFDDGTSTGLNVSGMRVYGNNISYSSSDVRKSVVVTFRENSEILVVRSVPITLSPATQITNDEKKYQILKATSDSIGAVQVTANNVSAKVDTMADGLLATGIDITKGTITATGDHFNWQTSDGTDILSMDENGANFSGNVEANTFSSTDERFKIGTDGIAYVNGMYSVGNIIVRKKDNPSSQMILEVSNSLNSESSVPSISFYHGTIDGKVYDPNDDSTFGSQEEELCICGRVDPKYTPLPILNLGTTDGEGAFVGVGNWLRVLSNIDANHHHYVNRQPIGNGTFINPHVVITQKTYANRVETIDVDAVNTTSIDLNIGSIKLGIGTQSGISTDPDGTIRLDDEKDSKSRTSVKIISSSKNTAIILPSSPSEGQLYIFIQAGAGALLFDPNGKYIAYGTTKSNKAKDAKSTHPGQWTFLLYDGVDTWHCSQLGISPF